MSQCHRCVWNQAILLFSLLITLSSIAYLITKFVIAYFITSLVIAYLINSLIIAYLVTTFLVQIGLDLIIKKSKNRHTNTQTNKQANKQTNTQKYKIKRDCYLIRVFIPKSCMHLKLLNGMVFCDIF